MGRPSVPDPDMAFITRASSYAAWRVWITFGELRLSQEYFGDARYGGSDAALSKARERRDALLLEHKIPLRSYEGNGFCVAHCNNQSGVIGVNLMLDDPDQPTRIGWGVTVMQNGRQKKYHRSIMKYGYREAWRLCCAIRDRHTGMQSPHDPPPAPEWLREWVQVRGGRIEE